MIVETQGTVRIRIASSRINYQIEDTMTVRGSIIPSPLPDGLAEIEVTSPAGWLYYEELDGVHTMWMGEEPKPQEEQRPADV